MQGCECVSTETQPPASVSKGLIPFFRIAIVLPTFQYWIAGEPSAVSRKCPLLAEHCLLATSCKSTQSGQPGARGAGAEQQRNAKVKRLLTEMLERWEA